MSATTVKFGADKLKVYGPKVDGGYTITFETGEYERKNVAKMLEIPTQTEIHVEVKYDENNER